jgi:hypothetical protein
MVATNKLVVMMAEMVGRAGFVSTGTDKDTLVCYQTTAAAVYKISAALTSATNLRVFNRSDKACTAFFPTAYFTIVEFY